MTEEGEEATVLGAGRKQSRRERFRDRLLKISDKVDKPKAKQRERDEDLDDFLKSPGDEDVLPRFPSPSRKPVPRISVSSSPRWSNAKDVTEKDDEEPLGVLKRHGRKKGLTVRFDQTAPQIIGEGGDECEAPTIRVSQVKLSNSAHTVQNERHAPVHPASVSSAERPEGEAHSGASDVSGDDFRPRILVRTPTGFGNGTIEPDAAARPENVEGVIQAPVQSHTSLLPSPAAGLKRKMLEEEARAFTSAVRNPSPEPLFQEQNNAPPQRPSENRSVSPTASYAHHERSASSASDLLSPPEQSPSPSRPSSSSSRESTIVRASAAQPVESELRANSAVRQKSTSPRRKPIPKSSAPQSNIDCLTEFRLHARRYYALFALSAERREPGLDASLSRWIRAATWWFSTAESNFKLLRKDLAEGATILQITSSRRHMQAMVDLAKTGWIVEDIVHDYAKVSSIDTSTPESVDKLIQAEPLSRRSRTLQYWQDLSKRFASLVAAVQRSGFMTSTTEDVPLSAGIDTTIWLTYPASDLQVAKWFRSASPSWVRMDDSETLAEPFDLAHVFPLKSSANMFRIRSMFCHISGGFQKEHRSPNVPCILTIARRCGSYALVLFISSQDHGINIVLETDPVRGDGIEWYKSNASVLFNFADGFQFLIELQKVDYLHLQECYDLALRASTATICDALRPANLGEMLIFRAISKTFEHRSKEKVPSFQYEGEQRDCEILLFEKYEVLGGKSSARKAHRGFRLSIMLSPQAASLGILDVNVGGEDPILIHTAHEYSPPRVELMDSHRGSLGIQFPQNRDFNRFYELLTSLDHSAPEDVFVEPMPLRSFSVEPSSPDARMFLSAATWSHTEVKIANPQSHLPGRVKDMASSPTINICVFSDKVVVADRLSQGMDGSTTTLMTLPY